MDKSVFRRNLLIALGILVALIIILSMGHTDSLQTLGSDPNRVLPALPDLSKAKLILQKILVLIRPI